MTDSREDCVLESAGRVLRQLSPVRQKHALIKLIENGEHHDLLALEYPDAAQAGSDEYAAMLDHFELELWELVDKEQRIR